MSFKLEKVEKPKKVKPATKVYEEIIASAEKKEPGWYKVTVGVKKPASIYQQLVKLCKNKKGLVLHKIGDQVYIEKL